MLPSWVIEQIRQREKEQEEKREEERPRVYQEVHVPNYGPANDPELDDPNRGKYEIDIMGDDDRDEGIVIIENLSGLKSFYRDLND